MTAAAPHLLGRSPLPSPPTVSPSPSKWLHPPRCSLSRCPSSRLSLAQHQLKTVVERTAREVSLSPTAQAAHARRDTEGRTTVQSHVQPPIPDALAQLGQIGWRLGHAEGRGDCSVLSIMAGHEIKNEQQVLYPSAATLKLVQKTRSATVSIIVGTEPIGGVIASKTFRGQENLCRTPQAAARGDEALAFESSLVLC